MKNINFEFFSKKNDNFPEEEREFVESHSESLEKQETDLGFGNEKNEKRIVSKSSNAEISEINKESIQERINRLKAITNQRKDGIIPEDKQPIKKYSPNINGARNTIASMEKQNSASSELLQKIKAELEVSLIQKEVENPEDLIKNDARYKAIETELNDKSLQEKISHYRRNGETQDTALSKAKFFGYHISADKIHQEFAKRYPDEYKLYQDKEELCVYRWAGEDPKYNQFETRCYEAKNTYMPWIEKIEEAKRLIWRDFIAQYPKKALAYANDKNIKEARTWQDTKAKDTKDGNIINQQNTKKNIGEDYIEEPGVLEQLSEVFKQNDIKSKVIPIENGYKFSKIVILENNEISEEKMVRLYRGVSHLDASILEQVPYAMRVENERGRPITIEAVRQEVEILAQKPTYENLIKYTNKVKQYLSSEEVRRMDEDLLDIENCVLGGYFTRKELSFRQIGHNGGTADSGITPYISASLDPYEAAGYGRSGGLIVIDIPLSEIESFDSDTMGEVRIKGALDKKYISAILPRNGGEMDEKEIDKEICRALKKVYELTGANIYENEELRSKRVENNYKKKELDEKNWKIDVEVIRRKRVEKLVKEFPEIKIDLQDLQQISIEQGLDVYTIVKRDIFDHYKMRFDKTSYSGERFDGCDRMMITDEVLLNFREFVRHQEQLVIERAKRR